MRSIRFVAEEVFLDSSVWGSVRGCAYYTTTEIGTEFDSVDFDSFCFVLSDGEGERQVKLNNDAVSEICSTVEDRIRETQLVGSEDAIYLHAVEVTEAAGKYSVDELASVAG